MTRPEKTVQHAVLDSADAADLLKRLEPALRAAAGGDGLTLASVALDLAAPAAPGAAVEVSAWVERRSRTLAFVAAEMRAEADQTALAVAQAVYRVPR